MAKAKFSRSQLLIDLEERRNDLMRKHKFDTRTGWAQVEGKDTQVIVDYGSYDMLCDLIEQYDPS
jgi:hypothetical protein